MPEAVVQINREPPQAPAAPAIALPAQEQGQNNNQNQMNEPFNAMGMLLNLLNRHAGKFSFVFNFRIFLIPISGEFRTEVSFQSKYEPNKQ